MRFHTLRMILIALLLSLPSAGAALADISTTEIKFPRGSTGTTVSGTIKGEATHDYIVRAGAGQEMSVTMTGSEIVYFNVLPPGSDDVAIHIGSTDGNSFAGTLSASGAYKIRVYQMRATARRGERGSFKLKIAVTGSTSDGSGNPSGGKGGLRGIAGMHSIDAIDEMTERGFVNVDSLSSGNTQYGIFWNPSTKVCAQLTMAGGEVLDASDIKTHPKCR